MHARPVESVPPGVSAETLVAVPAVAKNGHPHRSSSLVFVEIEKSGAVSSKLFYDTER